jgi:hypothetical protein
MPRRAANVQAVRARGYARAAARPKITPSPERRGSIMTRVLLLLFCVGVLAMGKAKTQEKKQEELTENGRTFNEKVTVRVWKESQKMFLNPVADQWAVRKDTKKGLMFDLRGGSTNTTPLKGSEITDKDGNVYVCDEVEAPPFGCFVTLKKKAEKKKP